MAYHTGQPDEREKLMKQIDRFAEWSDKMKCQDHQIQEEAVRSSLPSLKWSCSAVINSLSALRHLARLDRAIVVAIL